MTRICVFVDGENFRHSMVRLFEPDFQNRDYLPRNAQWTNLFDWVVSKIDDGAYRVRTYWYVIEHLDCSPRDIEALVRNPGRAESVVRRYQPYTVEIDAITDPAMRAQKIRDIVGELVEKQRQIRRRFDGWTRIQNDISREGVAIEFRRAGGIRYNLFDSTFGSEKAVDVNMACDMVALRDIYDIAVIFSGDQDYVPAMRIVKNAGKRVVNVSFRARNNHLLPGGAQRLNETADQSIILEHAELIKYLNIK